MSLFRFMSIAVVSIAIAVAVVSNLNDTFRLVFGNAGTVPIPLGLLALGAGSTGIVASVFLRLMATGSRRAPKVERPAAQPEFADEPMEEPYEPDDQPWREPAEPQDDRVPVARSNHSHDADRGNAPVYDANYRVIKAPPNPATPKPQVNSNLKSDEEDWGFDFKEEDG